MKKKILLVDDEETLRWALHEALTDEGFEIDNTNDGLKALECAKKAHYDLVISDLKMPTISGLQLISELKKIQPDILSVIMTAYGSVETVIEAMHIGVSDFITKPFKIEHIKKVIHRVLNASPALRNAEFVAGAEGGNKQKDDGDDPCSQKKSCFVVKEQKETDAHIFCDVAETDKSKSFLLGGIPRLAHTKNIGSVVKTMFRFLSKKYTSPSVLIKEVNLHLCKNVFERFPVVLACGVLDKQKQTLFYSIQGQGLVGFIAQSKGKVKILESSPFPLNLFPGIMVMENMVSVVPESKLVLIRSNLLSEGLKKGTITIDKFVDSVFGVGAASCEDMANGIKLMMGRYQESIAREEDSAVMVSDFESDPHTSWEEVMSIAVPVDNFEKLLVQFDNLLSTIVGDSFMRYAIVTSVSEAILNAVSFAYNHEGKNEVRLRFLKLGDEVIVEVGDRGRGFDVQNYTEPDVVSYRELTKKSGRGIFLMRQLMDRVMIQSSKEAGTTVCMAKKVVCNDN